MILLSDGRNLLELSSDDVHLTLVFPNKEEKILWYNAMVHVSQECTQKQRLVPCTYLH